MSAISSLASFNSRATTSSTQQSQIQRGATNQAQRGTTTTFSSGVSAARGNSASSASSSFCPTCGQSHSGSYCPTCNQAGGRQASITGFNTNTSGRTGGQQTGAAQGYQVFAKR